MHLDFLQPRDTSGVNQSAALGDTPILKFGFLDFLESIEFSKVNLSTTECNMHFPESDNLEKIM